MNYTALPKCDFISKNSQHQHINYGPKSLSTTSSNKWYPNLSNFGAQLLFLILFIAGLSGVSVIETASAQSPLFIEWDQHSHAVLTKNSNGQGNYDDRTATVSIALPSEDYEYSFAVNETKNDVSISNNDNPVQKEAISSEKFTGLEYTFDQDLDFGDWFISSLHSDSNKMYLLFRPDTTAINALTQTDNVTSELTITMNEIVDGELVHIATNSIAITIVGETIEIQSYWNSGFDGTLRVNKSKQHYNDISAILYYTNAEFDLEFSSVYETVLENGQESTVYSSTIADTTVNLGQYDSTNVQQFGNNLEYGTWYIVNRMNVLVYISVNY